MFRGCITYDKMGPLIEVKCRLNSQDYISHIVEPFLVFWSKFRRKK